MRRILSWLRALILPPNPPVVRLDDNYTLGEFSPPRSNSSKKGPPP